MGRDDLIDNLEASCERGELVTLTLRPLPGWNSVVSGVVLALGEHYTSRGALQVVFKAGGSVVIIGMTMIRDFQVGRPSISKAPADSGQAGTTAPGWTTKPAAG